MTQPKLPSSGPKPEQPTAPAVPAAQDVLLVHGISEDGQRLDVLRRRGDRIESGELHPLRSGRPIHGEVVKLHPRPSLPLLCDVEVQVAPPQKTTAAVPAPARRGPAQVASTAYRNNWDTIWAERRSRNLPN